MLNPKNRSYYNLDFVFDSLANEHLPFDYDAFARFKGNVVAAVTNVNTGKAEYLEVPRNDRKGTVLRASCALPILFPIITINNEKYMDGFNRTESNSEKLEEIYNVGYKITKNMLPQLLEYLNQ